MTWIKQHIEQVKVFASVLITLGVIWGVATAFNKVDNKSINNEIRSKKNLERIETIDGKLEDYDVVKYQLREIKTGQEEIKEILKSKK